MKKIIFLSLILSACQYLEHPFDHPIKETYNGYTIKKGKNHSSYRQVWPFKGHGMKFDFRFLGSVIHTPKDSSVHKLYGFSDNTHHSKNSIRLGWRMRQDSTIDLCTYIRIDGDLQPQRWIANINVEEEHTAQLRITDNSYIVIVDEKRVEIPGRTKKWLWGFKYRLYPYFEDGQGNGTPHDMTFYIYEY